MISSAWAHPVHEAIGDALAHHAMDRQLPADFLQGLLSGLGHPLIGVDHFAFIFAAGFFLALVNGGMWGIVALIVGTLLGAGIHLQGFDLPLGELGVAVSVIVAGVLVIWRRPLPLGAVAAGLMLLGILHGNAYAESIFGAETTPLLAYLVGFSAIQLAVATAAFVFHRKMMARSSRLSPALGSLVAAVGVVFLFL